MRTFPIQKNSFFITIRNREGIIYKGEARALSSYNDKGPFDILPLHANFISLIHTSIHFYTENGEEKEMPLDTGVLRVKKSIVEIYLGILHSFDELKKIR